MFRGCSSRDSSDAGSAQPRKQCLGAKVKNAVILCLALALFIGCADMVGQVYGLFCQRCDKTAMVSSCTGDVPGEALSAGANLLPGWECTLDEVPIYMCVYTWRFYSMCLSARCTGSFRDQDSDIIDCRAADDYPRGCKN
jgi:hypothetical protein